MIGPAGIATARWARRLFGREWRQQVMVLALLTLSLAAAIGLATATYNSDGVPGNATFGSANHRLTIDDPQPGELPGTLTSARERLGADAIVRWTRPIPGSVESLEFRSQDPRGPYGEPMLALVDGRYPTQPDEIAVTDGIAEAFGLAAGDTWALDGRRRRVVGTVENPSELASDFALAAPGQLDQAESVTLLVGGHGAFDEVRELRAFDVGTGDEPDVTTRDDAQNGKAAAIVLSVASIALLLVGLVAAAGFVAVAQRRLRQLGMFAATGATERQLRLVVIANGVFVGAVAALVGALLGLIAWALAAPRMEEPLGYRIDVWNIPWGLVAAAMALVILSATAAAWWPARIVSRVPVVSALSGRPPRPRPAEHSAGLAAALIAVGVASLLAGRGETAPFVMVGATATAAGALLLSPTAIRALGRAGRWLPVAPRLALRDLSRQRARSAVALAAISLALGIPAAIVVGATAAEQSRGLGNVSDRQLLVWTRDASQPAGVSPFYTQDPSDEGFSPYLPRLDADDIDGLRVQVDRIAERLGEASVEPLEIAADPNAPPTPDGRLAVTLAQRTEIGHLDVAPLFVATPALLARYGASADGAAEVLTIPPQDRLAPQARELLRSDELTYANVGDGRRTPSPVPQVKTLDSGYTSLPGSFVTPAAMRRHGWEPITAGWLVESGSPLTPAQVGTARRLAASAGMLVESRRAEPSLTALRWGATGAGLLLALGVLAMTVGLIRAEGARDLRALAATGASRTVRRTLTGTTAGALALLGGLIGLAGAYTGLGASFAGELGHLLPVPAPQLLAIVVGVPAVAAAAGWLVAGREPRGLARQALE
jgi:putative ABC transport system permease protein